MTDSVVLLRLLGMSVEQAMAEAHALINDRSVADLRRLLVVDDTAVLADRGDVFAHLLAPRRVPHLVCLSVGKPAHRGRMMLPASLTGDRGSAVLWIADPLGVDWQLGTSAVALLHPEDGPSGEECLIELLSSAEVFDRVRELVATMPNSVASPGIRLAESGIGAVDFPAALADAIRRLVTPSADGSQVMLEPYAELVPDRPAYRLRHDGELPRAAQRCADAAQAADSALAELVHLDGLTSRGQTADTRELVIEAGERLCDLRALAVRVLDALPADGMLTERQRKLLRDAGAFLTDMPGSRVGDDSADAAAGRPETPLAAVTRQIGLSLRRGESLTEVADRVAATERRLRRGMTTHQDQLSRCCPEPLTGRLLSPPPFPPPVAWLPLAGAVAAGLAGQAGIVAAVAAAVAWTGLTGLLARSADLSHRRRTAYLAANLSVGVVGGLFGWAVALGDRPSAPVAAGCVLLALAAAITAAIQSWRAQARAWRRTLRPTDAVRAASDLTDLVTADVSQLRSADASLLGAVARARIAAEAIGGRLRAFAERQHPYTGQNTDSLRQSQLGTVLSPFLVDLTLAVMSDLPTYRAPDGHIDHELAESATDKLIQVWIEHAYRHGPLAPPSFADDPDGGTAAISGPWTDAITAAVGSDPHGAMWQLCMPDDLALLDVGGRLRMLPFVPRAAQPVLSRSVPADTEWTSSGHKAGLLRLVPLKVAAVGTNPWPARDGPEQP